jgi:predicted transcriptional regulator
VARATLILRRKWTDERGNLYEIVIWRIDRNTLYPEAVRYRLAFIRSGEERPALLYDNHHPCDGETARCRFRRSSDRTGRRSEMKTVTFSIRPLSEVADDFAKTFDAVRTGRRIPKKSRDEVGFTSIEAARNFLTRERLALMRTIRTRHPGSLYELAKMVNRDFKNVQEDIGILERHGLVRISKEPRGKRKVKVPQVLFEEIALKIAI